MSVVLDASVTLAWVYGDEVSGAIRQVFEEVAERGAVVPSLWWLEVANSLTTAVRKRRIDVAFRQAALADLGVLDITTDAQTVEQAWSGILSQADAHRLTVYDAAYLELAKRRRLPLATLDEALRTAAVKTNVALAGV